MKTKILCGLAVATALAWFDAGQANAQVKLIAKGTLTESSAGLFADLSGLDYHLENGAPANLLGRLGSGIAWDSGIRFSRFRIAGRMQSALIRWWTTR